MRRPAVCPARARVLQLDEYVGTGPSDTRSFASQLRDELRGVPLDVIHMIDGSATDLPAEAARHDALLEEAPIDVAVLGLGRDGHVAFDEPPAPIRAVILTGYTSTGGLSEAEQMKGAWDEHQAPALLEEAGRDTAENASRSLPILLALGEARTIVVVSSGWHIRVPWFFAPYRDFGLRVEYRPSFTDGRWPRMLAHELRELRSARSERRSAMTAMRPPPGDLAA
jgi:hypothetical protein